MRRKSAVKLTRNNRRLSTDYESVRFIFNFFVFFNGIKVMKSSKKSLTPMV